MALITGWDRSTWNSGAWDEPVPVEVTGVSGNRQPSRQYQCNGCFRCQRDWITFRILGCDRVANGRFRCQRDWKPVDNYQFQSFRDRGFRRWWNRKCSDRLRIYGRWRFCHQFRWSGNCLE